MKKTVFVFCCFLLTLSAYAGEKCSHCGYDRNSEGDKYCINCGESLLPKEKCPRCGYLNPAGEEYCLECMTNLKSTQIQSVSSDEKDNAEHQSVKEDKEVAKTSEAPYPYKENKILLFPYQVVEGSAAKDGLWEDYNEKRITRAKPVVFSKSQAKITVIKKVQVIFSKDTAETLQQIKEKQAFKDERDAALMDMGKKTWASGEREAVYDKDVTLEVYEVSVETDTFTTLDGRPVGFKLLQGFVLAERLE